MKKITPDELRNAENDTGLSLEEIARRLENGVDIQYGDLMMRVEARQLEHVREYVAHLDADARRRSMLSVTSCLARSVPKVLKGHASKKTNDATFADMLLWQALKEVAAS